VRHESGVLRIGPGRKLPVPGPLASISLDQTGRLLTAVRPLRGAWVLDLGNLPGGARPLRHANATAVTTSPDGRWAATGTHHGRGVQVWDAHTGERLTPLIPEEPGVTPVFSPDGRWLVAAIPSAVRLWQTDSWELVRQIRPGQEPFAGGAAFSPDGRLLAVPLSLSGVQLRDPATGAVWAQLQPPDTGPAALVGFSPNGGHLAVATPTGAVRLWDLRQVRERLREIGLDWDLPPYPPAPGDGTPVRVELDLSPFDLGFDAGAYRRRGAQSAGRGRWADAAADYARALELDPSNHMTWHDAAPLRLVTGDTEGYRQVCRGMLARFGAATHPNVAERTAKTCCLAPGGVEDYGPVARLADRALLGTKDHGDYRWFLLARGLAEYRLGNFAGATDWLRKSLSPGAELPVRDGLAQLFLAMAHHRLGQADEARRALAEAHTMGQQIPPLDGDTIDNWPDGLRFHIARREAEELLIGKQEGRRAPASAPQGR
jgi:tetratricopeptide (TPR) repeat protein